MTQSRDYNSTPGPERDPEPHVSWDGHMCPHSLYVCRISHCPAGVGCRDRSVPGPADFMGEPKHVIIAVDDDMRRQINELVADDRQAVTEPAPREPEETKPTPKPYSFGNCTMHLSLGGGGGSGGVASPSASTSTVHIGGSALVGGSGGVAGPSASTDPTAGRYPSYFLTDDERAAQARQVLADWDAILADEAEDRRRDKVRGKVIDAVVYVVGISTWFALTIWAGYWYGALIAFVLAAVYVIPRRNEDDLRPTDVHIDPSPST